jgi:phosphoribosylformylglycinamidine synthase PurS subunit
VKGVLRATVVVRPKKGILDPQGDAVQRSLRKLGFDVSTARVGRVVDLELEAEDADRAHEAIERMCAELLANPLIESFEIQIDGS